MVELNQHYTDYSLHISSGLFNVNAQLSFIEELLVSSIQMFLRG